MNVHFAIMSLSSCPLLLVERTSGVLNCTQSSGFSGRTYFIGIPISVLVKIS